MIGCGGANKNRVRLPKDRRTQALGEDQLARRLLLQQLVVFRLKFDLELVSAPELHGLEPSLLVTRRRGKSGRKWSEKVGKPLGRFLTEIE